MKLFYREFGTGIPLVILHGLYGSSDNWVGIAKKLSANFRVILPDQRNHGNSGKDPVHTYSAMAQDIADLTDSLKIDRFFLAGHSMGGKCAIYFSMLYPEKLLGLTVIDISPFKPAENDNSAYLFHKKVLGQLCKLNTDSLQSREEADQQLSSEIHSARIRAFLLKNLSRDSNKKFILKLKPEILLDNLPYITDGLERKINPDPISGFPVRFIRAANSDYIPEKDIELIEQHYPAADIFTVKNSSHWIHAEQPDIIIELLLNQIE